MNVLKKNCSHYGYGRIFVGLMRVVSKKTLKKSWIKYPLAKDYLLAWNELVNGANWVSPQELKSQLRKSSIISNRRVVFDIHGNRFRLVVDVEYQFGIIFVVWFGTHSEYDLIDVKSIKYVKTD